MLSHLQQFSGRKRLLVLVAFLMAAALVAQGLRGESSATQFAGSHITNTTEAIASPSSESSSPESSTSSSTSSTTGAGPSAMTTPTFAFATTTSPLSTTTGMPPTQPAPPAASSPSSPTVSVTGRTLGITNPGPYLVNESDAALAADLDRMKAANVTWMRFDVQWAVVETSKGTYNWQKIDRVVDGARSRGLSVLGILDTVASWARPAGSNQFYGPKTAEDRANFANFAAKAASRYKGRVAAWEVWNEPNSSEFWQPQSSADEYAALSMVTVPAIRQVDAGVPILSGGTGRTYQASDINAISWYTTLYARGAAQKFDAISMHPYCDYRSGSSGEIAKASQLRSLMDNNGDSAKLLWATETGISTTGNGDTTTEQAAPALMTQLVTAWRAVPRHGPLFWYRSADYSNDPSGEGHFGLFRADGTAKPMYATLKNLAAAG